MRFNSIRFELSILHTVILGIILAVFSAILYIISNISFGQMDKELKTKVQAVDTTINFYMNILGDEPQALNKAVQKTISMKSEGYFSSKLKKVSDGWVKQSQSLNVHSDYINFFSSDKKVIISSQNLTPVLRNLFIEENFFPKTIKERFKNINYNNKTIRIITYRFDSNLPNEYFIQIGVSQDPLLQQLRNWLYAIILSLPLFLFLINYLDRKQASRIMDPVNEITHMANNITHHDLSVRIKPKHFDKEMGSLIESFNDMISRLEKSFKHIEEFSHHVAHELKTPLTIIKGEAELLLRKERSKHEYQQALRIVLEESERVLKIIEDLLLLTKLDYQPEVFKFEQFDFIEFLNELCEQARMLAVQKGVGITVSTQTARAPLTIRADKVHLRRLFFNILDNAIRLTPEGKLISIKVDTEDQKVITSIIDQGPGITPENLEKIFDKFFHTGNNSLGNGLGLSIAGTIAKIHSGSIQVESQINQGATFKIILPLG